MLQEVTHLKKKRSSCQEKKENERSAEGSSVNLTSLSGVELVFRRIEKHFNSLGGKSIYIENSGL